MVLDLESESEPEPETIRSPESESESEQPHHDSAPLHQCMYFFSHWGGSEHQLLVLATAR